MLSFLIPCLILVNLHTTAISLSTDDYRKCQVIPENHEMRKHCAQGHYKWERISRPERVFVGPVISHLRLNQCLSRCANLSSCEIVVYVEDKKECYVQKKQRQKYSLECQNCYIMRCCSKCIHNGIR
ncbi:unnamed protein product [Calicophoron daubneyi]|uniref:Apple domain-containing protein n=1 Tax=Calicophoron daubneyi TaxID=300641 RepID=A0AAV2T5A2_CALDB